MEFLDVSHSLDESNVSILASFDDKPHISGLLLTISESSVCCPSESLTERVSPIASRSRFDSKLLLPSLLSCDWGFAIVS